MRDFTRADEIRELDQLRRDFAAWEIMQQPELATWIAEQRPTEHSLHVIVAYTLRQLRDKLTAEEHRAR